jgi:hypothetical protein
MLCARIVIKNTVFYAAWSNKKDRTSFVGSTVFEDTIYYFRFLKCIYGNACPPWSNPMAAPKVLWLFPVLV